MIGPLILNFMTVFKSAGLNQARNAIGGASKDFGAFAAGVGRAAGALAGFQAVSGLRDFAVGAVEQTNQFQRNLLGLQQVFESATPALKNFIAEVENYGLSQSQAAKASVFIGSVLKQYGLSVFEASAQTQRLTKLAQDLATTYGYDVQEALLAITALFRGEYDPIEKFGVAMKQNEINAYLAAQGMGDLEGAELTLAQANARLTLLYERSADAAGAFARANDTLYASQQKLNAVYENLQISFGEPLQQPIANVLNQLTELGREIGPEIVEVSQAIGDAITNATPGLISFSTSFVNLLALLQPVIELLGGLTAVANTLLIPAFTIINGLLEGTIQFFDTWSAVIGSVELVLTRLSLAAEDNAFLSFLFMLDGPREPGPLIQLLNGMYENMVRNEQAARAASGEFEGFDAGIKRASVSLRASGLAARDAANGIDEAAVQSAALNAALRGAGAAADEATGQVGNLSSIFNSLDEEIEKSQAKKALEEMGVAAGLIEEVLTRANWQDIFGVIREYARLTAIDIAQIATATEAVALRLQREEMAELLAKLFEVDSNKVINTADKTAKDFVKAFTNGMRDAQQQASAAAQLGAMGASEGLIESILGAENWMSVWLAIKNGTLSIKELQQQFIKTAAGAEELRKRTQAIADAVESVGSVLGRLVPADELGEFQTDVLGIFSDFRNELKSLVDAEMISEANFQNILSWTEGFQNHLMKIAQIRDETVKQIAETEDKLKDVNAFQLSTADIENFMRPFEVVDDTISEYENNVTGFIDSIMEKLRDGLQQEIFTTEAAANLNEIVVASRNALNQIARDQAKVAKELEKFQEAFDFREATKAAVMSFADVTGILSAASDKLNQATKKASASTTEIIAQTIQSARNGRDYRVVLIRELEEVEKATASATDITDGLKEVLESTREFAANLKRLEAQGLNTEVFEQIVAAGTEVGNQTAKAILEGGPEAIEAINQLYEDIKIASADASNIAADEIYGLNGQLIDSGLQALKDRSGELAEQARVEAFGLVTAFQGQIDAYSVDLTKLLESLRSKEQALKDEAAKLGKAFGDTLALYVNNALAGMNVPTFDFTPPPIPGEEEGKKDDGGTEGDGGGVPPVDPGLQDEITELFKYIGDQAASGISGATGILIDSASDVGKAIAYLDERIGAALRYMDTFGMDTPEGRRANELASQWWRTRDMVSAEGFGGQPYVININVKTDSTQSNAMVGKTIGNVLQKYIQTGGGLVVSPVG